jgi:DNA-binding NarL/FixJ family response regulator
LTGRSGPIGPGCVCEALYFSGVARQKDRVKRILVIDDEAKLRTQTAELLRLESYEVTEGRNGREGVELARRTPPDLIVCDITMPEMNGHRVLETLRGDPKTAHVPFIFLTGWGEKDDVRAGMNLGADDYLVKPVDPAELLAAVSARLRRAASAISSAASSAGAREPRGEATPGQLEKLGLTPREAEVLFWVAQGKTNPEIATILGIGLTTVKKHLEATFTKLGVENRTSAAAMALENLR